MTIEKIKPIPKYIQKLIHKEDEKREIKPNGITRFYSYLTKNDGELVKVTVAVKHYKKQWYCKQVAVHGLHSKDCFVKDMVFHYLAGYGVGWYDEGLYAKEKWYEGPWGYAMDKWFDPYAPIVNKEYIGKFPEFKYSAYELYNGVDILKFLRTYEKYPQVEYLVKMGLTGYCKSKMILSKAKKDKQFCKWLYKNKEQIKLYNPYVSAILLAYKKNIDILTANRYEIKKKSLCRIKDSGLIGEAFNGNLQEYFNYVAEKDIDHVLYIDYLKACKQLGIDMSDKKNRIPHDFKRWHDIRIDEYKSFKAAQDEINRKEFYEQFAAIANKYLSLEKSNSDTYVVFIAKSPAELVKEGDALHHCVGHMGYDQKVVREESLIFFIRDANSPDTPLVTLEYSLANKRILQCYAEGNKRPDEELSRFVNKKWLPYANKQLKRISA